jgi:hypothetical protein
VTVLMSRFVTVLMSGFVTVLMSGFVTVLMSGFVTVLMSGFVTVLMYGLKFFKSLLKYCIYINILVQSLQCIFDKIVPYSFFM